MSAEIATGKKEYAVNSTLIQQKAQKGEIIQLNASDCYLKALSASVDWSEFNLRNVFTSFVNFCYVRLQLREQRPVTCPGCGPASFPVGHTR